ncbi:hypothetical protein QP185_09755 [Sphingomonas aerolata]|uniref:hypothetical protein n=1 Tax=Sphingomonas aerolata TaxID=185951 RepID=UPI002FE0211E
MSFLLAIEGADGAGKATASALVVGQVQAAGRSAAVISFPRYTDTVGGWALGAMLAGTLPRGTSPKAAAVLYALDRMESRDHLMTTMAANDVVVFDRYIASNMAYQAAQVPVDEADAMMAWIADLETRSFALPKPRSVRLSRYAGRHCTRADPPEAQAILYRRCVRRLRSGYRAPGPRPHQLCRDGGGRAAGPLGDRIDGRGRRFATASGHCTRYRCIAALNAPEGDRHGRHRYCHAYL